MLTHAPTSFVYVLLFHPTGKTTQIPQYLLSSGLVGRGQVGCTQPRRVAAISVAQRVAQEYGCTLGAQVGYSIRFEDATSERTRLKYITDGMLLREIMADPLLQRYNAIVLDEAHERTVNTDILFALLKQIQRKRKKILALRRERDQKQKQQHQQQQRATNSPALHGNKSPRLGAQSPSLHGSKSPRGKSPSGSPSVGPLDIAEPLSKTALKKKRKREQKEKAAAAAAGGVGASKEVTTTPTAEASAVASLTPSFSLDDDSLPDLDTITHLGDMQELKLVIMSATLAAKEFSTYFDGAPVLAIGGRTFPVELLHAEEAQVDYLDASIIAALQIHLDHSSTFPGDILVFLTGSEEIETARKAIEEKVRRVREDECPIGLRVCALYANLPSDVQMAVFEPAPPNTRKIILATNIAETSLTIPGIKFVIDAGVTKMRLFNPRTGGEVLKVVDISQAEAKQRAGRAGRDAPGTAFRLYTEEAFGRMKVDLIPEILRSNLSSVVLQLKSLHVRNVLKFDFMTRPSRDSLTKALEELYTLRALNYNGDLSDAGRLMVYFPLPPNWSRMLIKACEPAFDCAVEVAKILSVMSVEGIFFHAPKHATTAAERQTKAQRKQFAHNEGDHFTYLDALNAYLAHGQSSDTRSRGEWCRAHGLNHKNLEKVRKIYEQLGGIVQRLGLPFNSINERETGEALSNCTETDPIKKCLLFGLFMNVARRQVHDASYLTLADSTVVYLHPSSVLIGRPASQRPDLLVFNTLVHTSRAYMRECMSLPDLKWLVELVPEAYGDASHVEGATSKIRGGKEAAILHERLAGANDNQSKLAAARQTQAHARPQQLKTTTTPNKKDKSAPVTPKSPAPGTPKLPRPPKSAQKKGGGTRADNLLDFVNAL